MSESTPTSDFSTRDINQAAFMWTQPGAALIRMRPEGSKNVTMHFVFRLPLNEQEIGKLIFDYANGKTLVDPLKFVQKQSTLRDLLHTSLNTPRRPSP